VEVQQGLAQGGQLLTSVHGVKCRSDGAPGQSRNPAALTVSKHASKPPRR